MTAHRFPSQREPVGCPSWASNQPKESVMSKVTTKKAATRKAQPKKATSAWVKDQPTPKHDVTPTPKRARGAAKFAEATSRRPVPQPPVAATGKLEVFDALMAPIVGKGKANGERVSGPPIPTVEQAVTFASKADRLSKSMDEQRAVKAWKKAGEVGPKPATPASDSIGGGEKLTGRKASTTGARRSGVCTVVYFHDGVQQGEQYNTLSNLAYYTGGKGHTRLTSGELRTLLAANGIDSPETTEWKFTAPNNVVLSAKKA